MEWVILGVIAAALAAGTIIVVAWAIILLDKLIDWFRSKRSLLEEDTDRIAITIDQGIQNGEYVLIQGIYDKGEHKLLDGQAIHSKEREEKVAAIHKTRKLAIYE